MEPHESVRELFKISNYFLEQAKLHHRSRFSELSNQIGMSGGAEFTTEVAGARRVDVQGQGGSERQEVDEGLFLDGTSKKAKLRLALPKAHTLDRKSTRLNSSH